MSLFNLLEFTLKFNLASSDVAAWIYVALVLAIFVIGFGVIWGKCWSRGWSLSGHFGTLTIVVMAGVLAAYSAFNLRGASQMESWFKDQRATLANSVADSSRFKRNVIVSTWDSLASQGGQDGLTPPLEGGDEVRLNSQEDAIVLASAAAEEAKSSLRVKMPFKLGIPVSARDPRDVALEAIESIGFAADRYPAVVASTNEWADTAATLQANYAIDTAYELIGPEIGQLRSISFWLLITSALIALIVVPMSALSSIKINPTSKD
ncbi:tetraspanin family protein [Akkermansiaceae bacterium]|nr:tetraspanin family protein [Akkermansiaceae bacterium]MDA8960094.1 tetraspanin family protein [Akkermansiaceae bacterium]MDB4333252.1 tetraspanin family protein [Akkermansiaceae bacterium]MDC1405509.1 tetraspanin family protein [Akkermansiaceae bacterium]